MLHATALSRSNDRIAIVGIGCSFPGGVDSPDSLWAFLCRGGDGVVEVPANRWNVDAVHDPEPGLPGKTASRRAGFLGDISSFDAGFFGLSPREAAVMDPQQRLLLEVTWRALEDAGIPAEHLAGSKTGVYIGISHSDYHGIQQFGRRQVDVHTATGGALSIAANRLSHRFDLRGPSLAIDTACSSSLVALDAACTALLTNECDMTLVGGVNVMLTPDVTITFSRAAMLSPDGRCKAFDARANGYVRGEGAGIVILKLLSRALIDRDRIHAVIRATAVNQDGRTSTITVPSRDAQVAMLRQACARANVHPSRIQYVEAHGTGTPVGDPVEADAIGKVFGEARAANNRCLIGSIKTNIGHLEPAAGIAGLIKAALCVERGEIPANLHFESPNPHIDFDVLGISVPRALTPWPNGKGPRIAAVNSFGFGGTNACAIVEQPPRPAEALAHDAPPDWWPTLVPVSAASKTALTAIRNRVADSLAERPLAFRDIAGTLALRRSHLDHRLVVMARSAEDAVDVLRTGGGAAVSPAVVAGRRTEGRRLAFVFTGQGSQWSGMGRGLLQHDSLFRKSVEDCDELYRERSGWSLIEELMQPEETARINATVVAQPAIFAVQIALAARLAAWGIRPAAMIGHSIGEIAAAHLAGALSLAQAVDVVYHRSRLQERSRLQGGMAAVGIAAERASTYLKKFAGQLDLAAINGPELVSIAGPRALLEEFLADVGREQSGVLRQMLRVDYAFHSFQMDAFTEELGHSLRDLQPKALDVRVFSSVTGDEIQGEQFTAEYWCRNMRQPVLFKQAIERAIDAGIDTFVELGPHPSLIGPIRACLADARVQHGREGVALGTLQRGRPDAEAIASAAAALHVHGVAIDWTALVPQSWKFVELFGYPWEKQVHWAESEESRTARFDGPAHPLLGYRLPSTGPVWQCEIDAHSPRYLDDHRIDGALVFPAAGYVELVLAAARETLGAPPHEVEAIAFHEALFLGPEVSTLLETSVDEARGLVRVMSRQRGTDAWTLRATGRIRRWSGPEPPLECWTPKIEPPVQVGRARFYRDLTAEGHTFGPAFQAVDMIWYAEGCALGKIVRPDAIGAADEYVFHPAQLDACLQVIRGFRGFGADARPGAAMAIPVRIGQMRVFRRPSATIFARAKVLQDSATEIVAQIAIVDDTGRLVALIDEFRCLRMAKSQKKPQEVGAVFYRERWTPLSTRAEATKPTAIAPSLLILADNRGFGEGLAKSAEKGGVLATLVLRGAHDRQRAKCRYETTSVVGLRRMIGRLDPSPTHVIHLGALDRHDERPTTAGLVRARRVSIEDLTALIRELEDLPRKPRLCVVTAGDDADGGGNGLLVHAGITGFLRSLANEHPDYRPTLIDIQAGTSPDCLLEEILADSDETEIALRDGERLGLRLEALQETALPARRRRWDVKERTPAFRIGMSAPGLIENLVLAAMDRPVPQSGEVLVEVHAVGLNFRDVMAATGLLPADAEEAPAWQRLGFECAGVVTAVGAGVDAKLISRRVVAVTPGCMASHVVTPAASVFPIPRRMSFAEAAAIPVAFATAHYALVTLGRLKPGERVLIHAAAGAVGLAAVGIARSVGAEIYATAGTHEKRLHLYRCGVQHVFDSRSLEFADGVHWKTGGRGVDVVLNSLSGPFLEKSLALLAPGGRFLEIGKRDIYADTPLGLHTMRNNGAFYAIDLAKLAGDQPLLLRAEIESALAELARGRLRPLPITPYPVSKLADAFRCMFEARHIGKIVLSFDDRDAWLDEPDDARLPILADASYLITGGTSGFGLETARWLAANGARSLVLVGRTGRVASESEATIDALRSLGTSLTLVAADIGTRRGAEAALAAAERTGKPLRGVVHAAGVIDDALIARLSPDRIRRVFGGKVLGAWHLHQLTRNLQLDFFVLYSSIAATVGSPGQAHYAAANRMLDAIGRIRRSRGLPAASLAFGPIGDTGYLARRKDVARYIDGVGMQPLSASAALAALGTTLRHTPADLAFADIDWSRLEQSFTLASSQRTTGLVLNAAASDGGPEREARSFIVAAPKAQQNGVVADYLQRKVAAVLKVSPTAIEYERPLHEIGLDSLTALELKNRIETELGINLSIGKFLQRPTIAAIVPAIVASLNGDAASVAKSVEVDESGPSLSIGQEALWFIDRLDPGNPAYGLAACVSFRPHLNEDHLDRILQQLVLHNENLRFAFPSDGVGPVPILLPSERYRLIRHDATGLTEPEFSPLLQLEANRPFDLAQGPLSRLHLFRRQDRDVILLQFHHIVADAASIALLMDEVFEGYFALQAGLTLPPPRPRARFRNFVAWQRALVAGPVGDSHRAFWRRQLAGAPPSFPLATDRPRPLHPLGRGAARSFKVTEVVVEELKGLARAKETTLFSVLLAAFNVLLHRHSGASDIVVGTPMSGRTRPEFEQIVGYLVNALPIRTKISGDDSFETLLTAVDHTVRSALEHQDYPLPMIVRDVDPPREPGCFPIFQVMFGMERFHSTDRRGYAATLLNMPGPAIEDSGFTVESVGIGRSRAPLDMTFTIEEFGNQIFAVVDYRSDLWDESTIARIVDHYQAILHQVVAAPSCRISEFVLDRSEAEPICGRRVEGPLDVIESVRAVAAARPDATAISDRAGDMTYRALLDRVADLAGMMAELGIGPGARVGLCLSRSRDLPAAMLATLAVGAAYVPLDPYHPRQRLAAIIDDVAPGVILVDRNSAAALPDGAPLLVTDAGSRAATRFAPFLIETDDLAYIIHTSGSTGRPVGVEIGRSALANFLAGVCAELPLSPADALLAVTTHAFDIAVLELLLPLTLGARVVIADEELARDGCGLSARLARGDVTVMQATPATWQMLIDAGWNGDGRLMALCGGEALPSVLAGRILARTGSLWNLYGPTETTVWSTCARITNPDHIAIGRPLANVSCLVVDSSLRPVASGICGELMIGGAGLARGYYKDPTRTAQRFIADPLDSEGRRKVFRTGDFVRAEADGSLQFIGRRDQQVKVRGFRIELGEIEARLRTVPAVQDAAVVTIGNELLDRHLAAIVAVHPGSSAQPDDLMAALSEQLPHYMIPKVIRLVSAIPRLPNGKTDRLTLTKMAQVPAQTTEPQKPRTPIEARIVGILEELLGLQRFGTDESFFALGGTSLTGMRYIARINDVYGVKLGGSDLLRAPTVAAMARLVSERLTGGLMAETRQANTQPDAPAGQRLWRPLAMSRAEGAFDAIDAAAIAYLPDDVLDAARRIGSDAMVRRELPRADEPQWGGVCRLALGTIALVVVPRFGIDLVADPQLAVRAVDAATEYAVRLGARTAALTGLIPTVTDLGRALTPRQGLTITTGHPTTANAIVLTALAAARAVGRNLREETVAFIGLGAIGTATLRLLLDRVDHPRSMILCDVRAKKAELERLAHGTRAGFDFRGDISIICSSTEVPEDIYRSRFMIGATNAPGILDVARLRPGTVVVDDSFPHCYDAQHAIDRMSSRGDVLLVEGGFVSSGPVMWHANLPAHLAAVFGDAAGAGLVPDTSAITGCILSSLLSDRCGAAAAVGPADVETCRDHWQVLERMGICAAPLRCGGWSPTDAYLAEFRAQFGGVGASLPGV